MRAEVEARIVELRLLAPRLGPAHHRPRPGPRGRLARCRAAPRSTAAFVRHRLIDPQKRRRKRADYRRWERSRAMELWQMDVMGGVRLEDGRELKIVTGIDDHSRFCVCAKLAPGHGAPGLRGAPRRHGPLRRPRADPHRQRQGVHGALRPGARRGALRPPLPRERRPPPAHRAAQPDHHRQGRALPQDAARRVPRRAALRLARGGPGRARRLGRALQHRAPPSGHRHGRPGEALRPGGAAPGAGRAASRRTEETPEPAPRTVHPAREPRGAHQPRGPRLPRRRLARRRDGRARPARAASSRSPTAACSSPATPGVSRQGRGARGPRLRARAARAPRRDGAPVVRKVGRAAT